MRLSMLSLLVSLSLACGVAVAQKDAHPVAAAASTPAQRYATDATLRAQMQAIRSAVAGLDHYEHGHMGPEQAALLAGQVEEAVRTIVANCKLPPDADAALHAIIVPLVQNAAALKQDPKNLAAIVPMREALAVYARQFDDPAVAAK